LVFPSPLTYTQRSWDIAISSALIFLFVNFAPEFLTIANGFQVRPRSGLAAKHGIGILNSPGTIDSDYRGEVKIILINFSKEEFIIQPGERIAQLILSKVYKARLEETEELNYSKRGEGGFGHTGKS